MSGGSGGAARVGAVLLLPPRSVPKTTSGKIARRWCRAAYVGRTLASFKTQRSSHVLVVVVVVPTCRAPFLELTGRLPWRALRFEGGTLAVAHAWFDFSSAGGSGCGGSADGSGHGGAGGGGGALGVSGASSASGGGPCAEMSDEAILKVIVDAVAMSVRSAGVNAVIA